MVLDASWLLAQGVTSIKHPIVPGLAPHLHGFTLQVNGLTCGYAGTGPSNLYEVLQAAGVSEVQVAREDITQKSTKTIPLRLERAVTQYGDFQFA